MCAPQAGGPSFVSLSFLLWAQPVARTVPSFLLCLLLAKGVVPGSEGTGSEGTGSGAPSWGAGRVPHSPRLWGLSRALRTFGHTPVPAHRTPTGPPCSPHPHACTAGRRPEAPPSPSPLTLQPEASAAHLLPKDVAQTPRNPVSWLRISETLGQDLRWGRAARPRAGHVLLTVPCSPLPGAQAPKAPLCREDASVKWSKAEEEGKTPGCEGPDLGLRGAHPRLQAPRPPGPHAQCPALSPLPAGCTLLFYESDGRSGIEPGSVPKHAVWVENGIVQAVPEHPKKDFVFCLSNSLGDAFLFQVRGRFLSGLGRVLPASPSPQPSPARVAVTSGSPWKRRWWQTS